MDDQAMNARAILAAASLAVLLLLSGCSTTPYHGGGDTGPRPAPRDPKGLRLPDEDEMAELLDLSEVVLLGTVEARLEEPEGIFYRVRIREVLYESENARSRHKNSYAKGVRIRVASLHFRPGRPMTEIGHLGELSRYMFFLSPGAKEGEWLNLDDAAGYPLPEAQKILDDLRGRKRASEPAQPE